MSEDSVVISVKVSGGTTFEVEANTDWHVLKLKEACQEKCQVPVAQQRLIFKGKILKDGDKLSAHGVKSGQTMHLVKSAAQANTTQNNPSQSGIPMSADSSVRVSAHIPQVTVFQTSTPAAPTDQSAGGGTATDEIQIPFEQMIQGIMSNMGEYFIGGSINSNNGVNEGGANASGLRPNFIENLLSGMGIDQGERANVQEAFQHLLSPEMLQRTHQATFQILNNMRPQNGQPMNVADLLGGAGRSGTGQEENPGMGADNHRVEQLISNAMSFFGDRLTQNLQNPDNAFRANPSGAAADSSTSESASAGATSDGNVGATAPNSTQNIPPAGQSIPFAAGNPGMPHPELFSPLSFLRFQRYGSRWPMDANAPGAAGTTNDPRTPQQRYASQLSTLEEMGFIDSEANVQALQEANGDVNAAVSRLLERGLGN